MAKQTESALAEKQQGGNIVQFEGYGEFGGGGWENTNAEDFALPFISILQSGSPQIKKSDSAHVPGAEEGMLFNTVSEEIISGNEGFVFVPCHTERAVVEWKPRDQGGGFVAAHSEDSPMVAKCREEQGFGKWKSPDGNDLIDTRYMYGLVLLEPDNPNTEVEPVVIAFTSTKIKHYKKIMSSMNKLMVQTPNGKQRVPLFANRLVIKTQPDKNQHGSFFNFDVGFFNGSGVKGVLPPEVDGKMNPVLKQSVEFHKIASGGMARVSHESQNKTQGERPDGDEGAF